MRSSNGCLGSKSKLNHAIDKFPNDVPTMVLMLDSAIPNFAHGELVDSEAMKDILDKKNARCVTDFPDDLVWDLKNPFVIPHLGASTKEAEDAVVGNMKKILFSMFCCLSDFSSSSPTLDVSGGNGSRYNLGLFGDWNHYCQLSELPE